ncbi:MAG: glycerate kinase [Verrucomicrobia bacterium]|nr:glycerate kinase [Verrucomicrobiota bacterium]
MRVLVAPDKFKGSLSAHDVAAAIAEGWRAGSPPSLDLEFSCRPVADGGEGTAKAICEVLEGTWVSCTVRDPLGRPVAAKYALTSQGAVTTAVLDMSEASGLWRVAPDERRVERQSTYGTGEMLAHALRSSGADRAVIGLGGSATNDGGVGLAAALGFRFLDGSGLELEPVPADLLRLETIAPPPDLSWVAGRVVAAVDVFNPLLGERGATRVYGPQKGLAGESELRSLEAGLGRLADAVAAWRREDLRDRPGAGAAGGLGFGLMAFCGAEVRRGFDEVAELLGLAEAVAGSDLIITGEGSLDAQTLEGKAPAGVAGLARRFGKPCIAFAGRVEPDARPLLLAHFDEITALADGTVSTEEAIRRASELLRARAVELARHWGAARSG